MGKQSQNRNEKDKNEAGGGRPCQIPHHPAHGRQRKNGPHHNRHTANPRHHIHPVPVNGKEHGRKQCRRHPQPELPPHPINQGHRQRMKPEQNNVIPKRLPTQNQLIQPEPDILRGAVIPGHGIGIKHLENRGWLHNKSLDIIKLNVIIPHKRADKRRHVNHHCP